MNTMEWLCAVCGTIVRAPRESVAAGEPLWCADCVVQMVKPKLVVLPYFHAIRVDEPKRED